MKSDEVRDIYVAIPSYDGKLDAICVATLVGFMNDCAMRGWRMGMEICTGINPIQLARSAIAQKFLETPSTDLFYLDSDIGAEPGGMARLVEHPVDVVMGMYRMRNEREIYAYMSDETFKRDIDTGLMPIRGGPAGFLRIRRHVIEKMVADLGPKDWFIGPQKDKYPMIFNFAFYEDHTCGEDNYFCRKWEVLGGKVWCDPDIVLHHATRHCFSSNFWQSIDFKRRMGVFAADTAHFNELVR